MAWPWFAAVSLAVIVLQVALFIRLRPARKSGAAQLEQKVEALAAALERLEREMRDEGQRNRREWTEGQSLFRQETLDQLARWMTSLRLESQQAVNGMRQALDTKLEQVRITVDERLHNTLEQRLGDSFRLVSERLEQVHQGLGEMHQLAGGVGDLKRILSHVKVRGIWGEMQLDHLLAQVLTQEQYAANVSVRPGAVERVDFAVRLPGKGGADEPVWLPIDAKFPLEDYQRLVDAEERANATAVAEASKSLERRVREEAASIRGKYVVPPHTTDFAILFLPLEGLYAELLRRPGLLEELQRKERVLLTGPTTLGAVLTSLQIGFRTLAIEQRSSEVWRMLGSVKYEFQKFGDAIEKARRRLEQAGHDFDQIETRTRVINQRLRSVEELPSLESTELD